MTTSYVDYQTEGNVLVQSAQPEGETRPVLDDIRTASEDNETLVVLWYADHYVVEIG